MSKHENIDKWCYNCGLNGHLYKQCNQPITSYGIILYYRDPVKPNLIKYLLIQRNFSPEYRAIIHDLKNYFEQTDKLSTQIDHLTQLELRYLSHYPYQELFHQMIKHYSAKKTLKFQKNIQNSARGHQKLIRGAYNREGQYVKLEHILRRQSKANRPLEPDWGFPKGRRNKRFTESDLECAIREVFEETEVGPQDYKLEEPHVIFKEVFQGTNGTLYQHIYYLAQTPEYRPVYINPFNKPQLSEIRKIGWYTYEQASEMFREYHSEKRNLLTNVHQFLTRKKIS